MLKQVAGETGDWRREAGAFGALARLPGIGGFDAIEASFRPSDGREVECTLK